MNAAPSGQPEKSRPAALDFESELVKLEDRIIDMKKWAEEYAQTGQDPNIAQEIATLEARAQQMRSSLYRNLTHWQRVQVARHRDRPYTLDYLGILIEDFSELHGDRHFADDAAMVCGIGKFRGRSVAIVGQ